MTENAVFGDFVVGRTYNRRADIHARFGGQQQGGIATPSRYPVVFLFTGSTGAQHGYNDGWLADGSFQYFGEGQSGDMSWERGNRAIRDHAANGKDILIFEKLAKGGAVRFIGSFVCAGHSYREGPDSHGANRKAIVFTLVPVDTLDHPPASDVDSAPKSEETTLEALRRAAYRAALPSAASKKSDAVRTIYQRSADVRRYVLERSAGRCEGCARSAPFLRANGEPYLEPHHIRRVSDGGPDDPRFVIALCPNCHREAHFGHSAEAMRQKHTQIVGESEAASPVKFED